MSLLDALLLDPYPFEIWIAKPTDIAAGGGSGTVNDPYNASTATAFDQLMTTIGNLSADKIGTVHLGPVDPLYPFETNGFNARTGAGWQPKKGTRIVGSGIDATTLKLVGASETATATHYFIIGHTISDAASQRDMLEISHMTLDCNLSDRVHRGHVFSFAKVQI